MKLRRALQCLAGLVLLAPPALRAETEIVSTVIGMDTVLTFTHASVPGAEGMNFSFIGALSPMYPDTESHLLVVDFEWGAAAAGPWSVGPDIMTTVPGGMTTVMDTGVFHGPAETPFVRIRFHAGGPMVASGEFTHVSLVPEPASAGLLMSGLVALAAGRRRRLAQG